ncbi:uncharacterized protein G2W53_001171 [Senna tora]|uniref:Uncharacterized protein n=1 Tax=Senna tora TaxID=362788 RepID=A0A834XI24_9FABA|nr:uncharacterized protein G2W53_001171 [Senna tora]
MDAFEKLIENVKVLKEGEDLNFSSKAMETR